MKATFVDWAKCTRQREFIAILALGQECQHLVRVHDIMREGDSKLYFACEYMPDGDLKDLLVKTRKQGKKLEPALIQSILHQVLCGLQHIHARGFMHRDLKPENLLMNGTTCKVADFSLARLASICNEDQYGRMTTYVSSRWYRAPEIVLEAPQYTTAIDVFALGCIMAELYSLQALFPGKSEHDQLPVMMNLLGPLREQEWPEGVRLLEKLQVNIPDHGHHPDVSVPQRLANKIGLSDSNSIDLLGKLLRLNPCDRPTVQAALGHAYFAPAPSPSADMQSPQLEAFESLDDMPENAFFDQTPIKEAAMTLSALRRAPVVSVSPSARSNLMVDPRFPDFGHVESVTSSQSKFSMGPSKRGFSPPIPSQSNHHTNLFCDSKRWRSGYRPADAFGID